MTGDASLSVRRGSPDLAWMWPPGGPRVHDVCRTLSSNIGNERGIFTGILLARIRAGDRNALEELIARDLPRLRRWATGRLPGWARERDDTDDLVQDTVIRSLEKLEGFDPQHEAALQAYLRQAVLNRIRDLVRRAQRKPAIVPLDEDMTFAGGKPPRSRDLERRRSPGTTPDRRRCPLESSRRSSAVSNWATTTTNWPLRSGNRRAPRHAWRCGGRCCGSRRKCGMLEADPVLVSLADAIADGLPIDWPSTDAADLTPDDRRLVAELRVLESLHTLHRRHGASPEPGVPQADIATKTGAPVRTWGHLQIRGIIGTGGFGVVYRAWDPHLASEVALKVLARDTGIGDAVIAEASLLARVRHPNIVSIYGADRCNEEVGLWMELIRGRTLSEIVRTHGTFGAREAAVVGLDLTRALATVHGAGLVHRDVKAQNVMREEGGRVVLMDFGAGVESAGAAAQARIVGTPLYIAPEQLDRPESTPQSDIYSLGVLLYHIVTGSYPIAADSLAAAEAAHRQGQRNRLRDVRSDLPTEFVQIVERAMHPDLGERYRSAGELEGALAQFVVRDEVPDRFDDDDGDACRRTASAPPPPRGSGGHCGARRRRNCRVGVPGLCAPHSAARHGGGSAIAGRPALHEHVRRSCAGVLRRRDD